jgi:16S rRNA (cytidine1402-2'-O)-methyltransferase
MTTLEAIHKLDPNRQLVVARELTKKFEEIQRGTAEQLIAYWEKSPLKGEIVLLIDGSQIEAADWSAWTPQEHVQWMQDTYGLSLQESIKMVAELRQVPKRQIYNQIHQNER